MNNSFSDFSFVLCPGHRPDPKYAELYNQIYDCWYAVWSEAFRELGVTQKMHSDALTRQDLIAAAFFKNECIGMSFLRWVDLRERNSTEDSYFKIWSEEHRQALASRGPLVIVCSNLTLHPMARRQRLGIVAKDLIAGMAIQTFLNSNADAMTAAMRIDRGANTTVARWGGSTIAAQVACDYGTNNTELMGLFRDELLAKSPQHELWELSQYLWKQRTLIPQIGIDSEFEKKVIPFRKKAPKAA